MADEKLIKYIKDNLSRGFQKDEIEEKLLRAGYSPRSVMESFRIIGSGKSLKKNPALPFILLAVLLCFIIILAFVLVNSDSRLPSNYYKEPYAVFTKALDTDTSHYWEQLLKDTKCNTGKALVNIIEINQSPEGLDYRCMKGPSYDALKYHLKENLSFFSGKFLRCDDIMAYSVIDLARNKEAGMKYCVANMNETIPDNLTHFYFLKLACGKRVKINISEHVCANFFDTSKEKEVFSDSLYFIFDPETGKVYY